MIKLGPVEYITWVRGGGPCDSEKTLRKARKAAKRCEKSGGSKHDIYRMQLVKTR